MRYEKQWETDVLRGREMADVFVDTWHLVLA